MNQAGVKQGGRDGGASQLVASPGPGIQSDARAAIALVSAEVGRAAWSRISWFHVVDRAWVTRVRIHPPTTASLNSTALGKPVIRGLRHPVQMLLELLFGDVD